MVIVVKQGNYKNIKIYRRDGRDGRDGRNGH